MIGRFFVGLAATLFVLVVQTVMIAYTVTAFLFWDVRAFSKTNWEWDDAWEIITEAWLRGVEGLR